MLPHKTYAITADDVVCVACIGPFEVEDNAIFGAQIKNNSIKNEDINATAGISPSKISGTAWTASNDGSESGLDADMLATDSPL